MQHNSNFTRPDIKKLIHSFIHPPVLSLVGTFIEQEHNSKLSSRKARNPRGTNS